MNLHRVDLVSLSLFSLVARTGSISKGAELASLAVGAASKRLSDLERSLGTPLLERHSRGVTLTQAGLALQRHARRILADVDEMAADLSDYASGMTGVVRMWATTSAVTQFLPQQLSTFSLAHPGIRIELEEANSDDVVHAVLDGRSDLGIFAERTATFGLQVLDYRDDRLALVAPEDHPLAARPAVGLADALEYEFVTLSQGTSIAKRLTAEAEALGRVLKNRVQVRSFDAICQMVAAGMGVALLPDAAVEPLLRALKLRRIALDEPWATRSLLIGVRDLDGLQRHVRRFLDHLVRGD